jgi:signal transduction histidine kinase
VRRVPIRLKLTAALVIPLLGLLTVTWFEVRSISQEVAAVKAQAELAEASLGPSSLLTALQQERAAAAVYMIGQEANFALEMDYPEARAFVDTAREKTRRWVEDDRIGDLARAYGPALDSLSALDQIRAEIEATPDGARNLANATRSGELFDRYSQLMEPLFDANREISYSIDDDGLRRGVELYSLVAQQTDTMALLVKDLIIPAALGRDLDEPPNVRLVGSELADLRARERAIRTKADGVYGPMAERLLTTDHIVALPQLAQEALDTGNIRLAEIIQNSLGTDPETFGYLVFRNDLRAEITRQAAGAREAADARLRRYVILAVLASVLAVGATWAVSRSITRPLRSLDRQARDLATRRLPTAVRDILETPLGEDVQVPSMRPIVVKSRDEVADVVNALNTVQDSALDLAIEQAVMRRNLADSFVNLGRRNQNLLSRQLDFITVLEAGEVEPNILGSLFRLDHLATRMRRNAESLLVLAGIDPPRKWSAPLRLNDVVRAALGEVEDYHRVVAEDLGPVTVMGQVGADLAHLVAELVENALTFSPADDEVQVRGRPRQDGGYTVAIIDAGPGMAGHDLSAANRRLAGEESFTVAPSKYLGHYVAGHLAARHGIGLHLEARATTTGIIAVIDLPPSLLVSGGLPGPVAAPTPGVPAPAARGPQPYGPSGAPAPVAGASLAGPSPGPAGPPPSGRRVAVLDAHPATRPTVRPLPPDAPAPFPAPAARHDGRGLPEVHPDAPWHAQVPARPPLQRRSPGAQPVSTAVPQVRRAGHAPPPPRPRSPEAVHDLIANFAAGVRQGRAQARRPGGPPSR